MSYIYQNSKETIDLLFIDDDVNVLQSIHRIFARDDLHIRFAYSGEEAIEYLNHPVRVVVSDNQMAGISGVEVLKQFKNADESISRILLTGCAEVESISQAINDARIHKFIQKPWNPIELRKMIFQELALQSENIAKREAIEQSRIIRKSQ